MISNKQAINNDKMKIMIITNNKETKINFNINIKGKSIKHSTKITALGYTLNENMDWSSMINHGRDSIFIPTEDKT